MLKFRGLIIKYIRYEGEGGSLEIRMLPLKLIFLLNWNRGGGRDNFMIITGLFIKITVAQFSPFLTPPHCSLSEKKKSLRMYASGLTLSFLSHSLIPLRGLVSRVKSTLNNSGWRWGDIFEKICCTPDLRMRMIRPEKSTTNEQFQNVPTDRRTR